MLTGSATGMVTKPPRPVTNPPTAPPTTCSRITLSTPSSGSEVRRRAASAMLVADRRGPRPSRPASMNTCTSRPIALSSGALARAASRADAVRSDSSPPGVSRSRSPMRRVCHPEANRLVAAAPARMTPSSSELRWGALGGDGGEEVEPEPFGEVLGRQLAADAVAGRVQRRGVRGQPALAGGDRDDAPADAALARDPDLVEPVARQLVQPGA